MSALTKYNPVFGAGATKPGLASRLGDKLKTIGQRVGTHVRDNANTYAGAGAGAASGGFIGHAGTKGHGGDKETQRRNALIGAGVGVAGGALFGRRIDSFNRKNDQMFLHNKGVWDNEAQFRAAENIKSTGGVSADPSAAREHIDEASRWAKDNLDAFGSEVQAYRNRHLKASLGTGAAAGTLGGALMADIEGLKNGTFTGNTHKRSRRNKEKAAMFSATSRDNRTPFVGNTQFPTEGSKAPMKSDLNKTQDVASATITPPKLAAERSDPLLSYLSDKGAAELHKLAKKLEDNAKYHKRMEMPETHVDHDPLPSKDQMSRAQDEKADDLKALFTHPSKRK